MPTAEHAAGLSTRKQQLITTVQSPMNLLKFMLDYDNIIRVSGLNLFIQRSAVNVHDKGTFSYWARKIMAATCLQWSPYETINWLLTFRNSRLAAVVTLQCVCLQNTTQTKLNIYIFKGRIYVTFGLEFNCHCCTIVYQIITQLIETLCKEI